MNQATMLFNNKSAGEGITKENWFGKFGNGSEWVQGLMNGLLGTFFVMAIVVFATKFVMTAIKAKTSGSDEERQKIRKSNVKNVIAIIALLAVSSCTFAFINLFEFNMEFSDESVFENLFNGKSQGNSDLAEQAQHYFNLTMSLLICIAIGIFIVVMPLKLIKYMASDDENKIKLRKNMISSTIWLIAIVLVLFITVLVVNILPNFEKFSS